MGVARKESDNSRDWSLLWQPVRKYCKVTPHRIGLLERLNINTVYDLVNHMPTRYENWADIKAIASLENGLDQAIKAEVIRVPSLRRKGKFSTLSTMLSDGTDIIKAIWFNQPYYKDKLRKGDRFFLYGRVKRQNGFFEIVNPAFRPADSIDELSLLPVYPLTKGLTQAAIRGYVKECLPQIYSSLPDILPDDIVREERLVDLAEAYASIHFPKDENALAAARDRLAYEELFLVLAEFSLMKRKKAGRNSAYPIRMDREKAMIFKRKVDSLPYKLTVDQMRTINEIVSDMANKRPMSRLVQGDVGSGKTIVAALSMYAVALAGMQSIMMVPTSVLAEQHFRNLKSMFSDDDFSVDLMLGSTSASEKKAIRERLSSGRTRILIGTQAVLSEQNEFKMPALLVTDEQHRFGVRQRTLLLQRSGRDIHTLVMSATPIPRTLALIVYADLDLSNITTAPAGRPKIETYLAGQSDEDRVYDIVSRQLVEGRQVYYVCPSIESDEESDKVSAVELYETLSKGRFSGYRVGLLHGALKPDDKERVMHDFLSRKVDLLICTTVVEVGVDNPNASLIVIENAECYGLATLHQLRGRVGRGSYRSVCILKSAAESDKIMERLRFVCSNSDGFVLAQKDLETRGPGDFFGTRQHGLPALRFSDYHTDMPKMQRISKQVEAYIDLISESGAGSTDDLAALFELKYGAFRGRSSL